MLLTRIFGLFPIALPPVRHTAAGLIDKIIDTPALLTYGRMWKKLILISINHRIAKVLQAATIDSPTSTLKMAGLCVAFFYHVRKIIYLRLKKTPGLI